MNSTVSPWARRPLSLKYCSCSPQRDDVLEVFFGGAGFAGLEEPVGVGGGQVLGDQADPAVVSAPGGGGEAAVKPNRARVSTVMPVWVAALVRAATLTLGCHVFSTAAFSRRPCSPVAF
ncbi:hypothetical protein [Streptomyces flavidovirens]|uniref:hypothetical protein n=1 Tax=Streptomyces flavidovirens TaxID=67298 RepID=UPI00368B6BD2